MSILYFKELADHPDQAAQLQQQTFRTLSPFYGYLKNAIKSYKNREIVADWEPAPEYFVQLVPLHRVYLIQSSSRIRLKFSRGWYRVKGLTGSPDWQEAIRIKLANGEKLELTVDQGQQKRWEGEQYVQLELDQEVEAVVWGFDKIDLLPVWVDAEAIRTISQAGKPLDFTVSEEGISISSYVNPKKQLLINGISLPYEVEEAESELSGFDHFDLSPSVRIKELNQAPFKGRTPRIITATTAPPASVSAREIPDFWKQYPSEIGKFKLPGTELSMENSLRLEYRVSDPDKISIESTLTSEKGIQFQVREVKRNKTPADNYWIQLLEPDKETEDGTFASRSSLDYFFDEDVEVTVLGRNGSKHKNGNQGQKHLQIDRQHRNFEEKKIVLREKGKGGRYYLPAKGERLQVRVNTHNLRMQQEAIKALQNQPIRHHKALLDLFQPRKDIKWVEFEPERIDLWFVLTKEDRKGTAEQRRFVEKAIATPDFAILEGPPGSGKTTAIIELILQLTLLGKKVLFCGSTHVAIDNVLERLKTQDLLSLVMPLRIGALDRIQDDIREFQLGEMVSAHPEVGEDLILDAANLVCGTTIGILQHPFFKMRPEEEPAAPRFDYLIIDECSKTPFQEFLVPAVYAKKWVLVGDVMQLSPFTDREVIVSNLKELEYGERQVGGKPKSMTLPVALQQACLIINKLDRFENRIILKLDLETIQHFQREIPKRDIRKMKGIQFGIVTQKEPTKPAPGNFHHWGAHRLIKEEAIRLAGMDVILVESKVYAEVQDYLPTNFTVVGDNYWEDSSHGFRFNYMDRPGSGKNDFYLWDRGNDFNGGIQVSDHYNQFFKEKSWAEEIAWRLVRRYELRSKGESEKSEKYNRHIEDLKPRTRDIDDALFRIENFSLPSVLEGLQKGIRGRRSMNPRFESTLTAGFSKSELACRHEKLIWQHRMHGEISDLPRDLFYQGTALKDSPMLEEERKWDYRRYPKRRTWLHVVEPGRQYGSRNGQEVNAIEREIKAFLKFASSHKNPTHPEGIWEIAVLTFYRGQERALREMLKKLFSYPEKYSGGRFDRKAKHNVYVKLNTVDKFQGQEADLVLLSMVHNTRVGFMDSPNRLNVGITRAKFQLVIVGNQEFFANSGRRKNDVSDLESLASKTQTMEVNK